MVSGHILYCTRPLCLQIHLILILCLYACMLQLPLSPHPSGHSFRPRALSACQRLYSKRNFVPVRGCIQSETLRLPEAVFKEKLCVASGCIQRETWGMGPCAGVDYNLTLSHSRLRRQVAKFKVPYWGIKSTMA
jgi:hypothetical protein